MKLKYFAWIKDITNSEEENINQIEINNLDKLKDFIIIKYPDLKKHYEKEILMLYHKKILLYPMKCLGGTLFVFEKKMIIFQPILLFNLPLE